MILDRFSKFFLVSLVLVFFGWSIWALALPESPERTGELLGLSRALIHLGLFSCLSCVLNRTAGAKSFLLSGLLGLGFYHFDVFALSIHPLLLKFNFYPSWLGRGGDQQSPQYAMIISFLILVLTLLPMVIVRRMRSPQRVAMLLISVSMLFTGWLFHKVVVWEIGHVEARVKKSAIMAVGFSSDEQFDFFCSQSGAFCSSVGGDVPDLSGLGVDFHNQAKKSAADIIMAGGSPGNVAFWRETANSADFNRLPTALLAVGMGPSKKIRVWADTIEHRSFIMLNEKVFAILALCAHSTWFFGGLGLLWFHMMKKKGLMPK